ncbi:hypothetical protein JCM16303_006041 [Sporobolomyces ruberrimus]
MSTHADPFRRRETFHSSNLTRSAAQEKRRKLALNAQRERRTHAIEAARNSSRDLFDMEDLALADSDQSGGEDNESHDHGHDHQQLSVPTASGPSLPVPPQISKQKRNSHKPVFRSWAKNLLCHAETLDLREGLLPYGFERDWRLSVVPSGKRCLCATTNDSGGKNTILYSRVAGRTLARLHSILPGDCLLDVVWNREQSMLWVLDTCKWRGNYIVACEADFRAFFTSSKLSELSTQLYIAPTPTLAIPTVSTRPLLILPCPSYSSPLTASALLSIIPSLSSSCSFNVSVLQPSSASPASVTEKTIQVLFEPSGALLYHRESHYESGTTPLVNWVPREVEPGREKAEGVARLRELVEEWESRGGEAGRTEQKMDDAESSEEGHMHD